MEVRPYIEESDYPVLCEWWKGHKWPPIPAPMLPQTGLIIPGYCAGFVYRTDSSIAMIEWIISNPKAAREHRSQALDELIQALVNKARDLGYSAAFSFIKHPLLLKRYEKTGFTVTDQGMIHGIWRLS